MAYCHECGDQVAEIDVFCPHCGISLEPVALPGEAEDSPENTIAISPSEIAETLGKVDSANNASASPAMAEESLQPILQQKTSPETVDSPAKDSESGAGQTEDGVDMKTDDFSNPVTEENINAKTESIEIPADLFKPEPADDFEFSEPDQIETPVFPQDSVEESIGKQPGEIEETIKKQPFYGQSAVEEKSPEIKDSAIDDWDSYSPVPESSEVSQTETLESAETFAENTEKSVESPIGNIEPEVAPPPSTPSFTSDQNDYFSDISADTGDVREPSGSLTDAAFEDFVPEKTPDVESETESSMMSYQETEIKELNEVEESELPANKKIETAAEEFENISGQQDSGFPPANTVEEPPIPSALSETENKPVDSFSPETGKDVSQQTEIKDETSLEDLSKPEVFAPAIPEKEPLVTVEDENETPFESSIVKPDFEFEPEEEPPVLSRFDSVRIMESHEDSAEDLSKNQLYNNLPSTSATPPQPDLTAPKPQISEPIEEDSTRESRSYTTPNIGVSDTDGKKSKLKPLDEGTILNARYEIVRKIGGGGMGAVYLASDKNLGGVLRAVKEMVQSYIEETQQEKAINDFKRESMLLTSLEHPAIPTIFDYFYDEKEARFYLVMKYINGGDLAMRLRAAPEGKIDEKSVVEWAMQVADVLDYLHQRQPPIVYRDLKPANIMIDGNTGRIMLIDFGIARWINKEEKGVTAVGTMGYAPPELFSGNVEARSDIYSLGSTMFHLLTGADPQSNPLLIFDFQKNPLPRQINPQLSDQMERILMQAVEYNAEKRFASAGKLRQALAEHLDNLKANSVTFGVKETPQAVTLSEQKVFCGFCGQSIVASDLFCAFCGAKQPIAQKGVHGESYSSAPVTARLTILGTNELESPSYTIEKDENLVGRRDPMSNIFPEVDLSKFDPQTKISRRHARIWRDGNKFMVEDLGSSNGTVLMPVINEAFRLVPNKPHILTNGDKLKLGDTTLHFVIG